MRSLRVAVLSVVCAILLAGSCLARGVHLSGAIASHSEIGLAAFGGRLYAAYWVKNGNHPWPLTVVAIDASSGNVLVQTQVEKRNPLRSRNGKIIAPDANLYLSQQGTVLLCVDVASGTVWTLKAANLRVLSQTKLAQEGAILGFTKAGSLRTFLARKNPINGEIRAVTVIDHDARSLGKVVGHHDVEFTEPALEFVSPDSGGVVWALDARRSKSGNARVSAYSLDSGRLLSVWEIRNTPVESGAPAFSLAPKGHALPPPVGAIFLGEANASQQPQFAQLRPVGDHVALIDLDQPSLGWRQWSRVARVEMGSGSLVLSKPVLNCNLQLDSVGLASRIAVGNCDRVGRTLFDEYVVKSSVAVIVSVDTGQILATVPLNRGWDALAFSVDDMVSPAVIGIYDHRNEVRLVQVPPPSNPR